jgi:valyl-tRNA synthetase
MRSELAALAGDDAAAQRAVVHLTEALNAIRKAKTDQKLSVGTPVKHVIYSAPDEAVRGLTLVERDLKAACRADSLVLTAAAEAGVQITPKPAET